MAPPLGLTRASSSLQAEVAQHRQALSSKGFVEFNDIHLVQRQAGLGQHLAHCRRRAKAHDARRHTGRRHGRQRGPAASGRWLGPAALASNRAQAPSLTPEALPAVTDSSGPLTPLSLASISSVVSGRGCSSVSTTTGSPFFARNPHRDQLVGKTPRGVGRSPALLRAQCKRVLVRARDVEVGRHVVSGLRHRMGVVQLLHQRVGKTPANGGVENGSAARLGAFGLGHDKWRARHALDTAGNHQLGVARPDGACRHANAVQ